MPRSLKVVLCLILAVVLLGWLLHAPTPPQPTPKTTEPAPQEAATAPLGSPPDWSALDSFQESISREDFEFLLTNVFTTGEAWRKYIHVTQEGAEVVTGTENPEKRFQLSFARPGTEIKPPRHWRAASQLPAAPADKPLEGLRIAIDPGHIGGEWAKMEGRWFSIQGATPVCEGDMTLIVARLLKPRLEALGANVSLVREAAAPLTPLRPQDLVSEVAGSQDPVKEAERLFYRTAEIRARAERVNVQLKPDLVLCLHFNAEPWGDANSPTLVERSHFHLLLNGGYTDEEVMLEDQRFELLRKLLQRTHEEEVSIGTDVAASFYSATGLPPYHYETGAGNARTVAGNPFLWARNLLANRLYDCPVIFLEPYVMNSRSDYPRMLAGDYDGVQKIGGRPLPSIFREYADALTTGLANHYRRARQKKSCE